MRNGTDVPVIAEFPLAELVHVEHLFGSLINELHIIIVKKGKKSFKKILT